MSHINIVRIKAVYYALGALQDKVVFVGGATVSLYPDRRQFEVRPTDDVDVIVEVLNYVDRAELEEQLSSIGFKHDIESSIICRYKVQGITVDIMPTNDASIGFKNIWYPEGFRQSVYHAIDERTTIKILSPVYFIATKLEAFKGRGKGDGRTSHDFEDIVFVLENRKAIWEELASCDEELKKYLKAEFKNILNDPNVFEWIDCHVERGSPPLSYYIVDQLKAFCK